MLMFQVLRLLKTWTIPSYIRYNEWNILERLLGFTGFLRVTLNAMRIHGLGGFVTFEIEGEQRRWWALMTVFRNERPRSRGDLRIFLSPSFIVPPGFRLFRGESWVFFLWSALLYNDVIQRNNGSLRWKRNNHIFIMNRLKKDGIRSVGHGNDWKWTLLSNDFM